MEIGIAYKNLKYTVLFICIFQSCSFVSQNSKVYKDPKESKLYTTDIDNFYKAFDMVLKDTSKAVTIFKKEYFRKGTKGLKDFYKTKIKSVEKFAKFVIRHQEFYKSIRGDLSNIEDLKEQIYRSFQTFKEIYPKAVFPDVYFVIGRFSSNGTISKRGLLIGTEILSKTSTTNTEKWNKNIARISMFRDHIPVTVSHELIHFNQKKMKEENTLLAYSIGEGSAEFIAELISGKTDGNYDAFKEIRSQVLQDFEKEKEKDIWRSWHQKSDKRPRNAGYWMGYMICRSYYEQHGNINKTVDVILNMQDYAQFYEKSNVATFIKKQ